MKTKYERMSREEKKEVINSFKIEKSELYRKFRNMNILCYIGIVYSFIVFFYDLLIKKSTINYILDIIIFVFSVLVLFKVKHIKKEMLNNYVLKNKRF